MSLQDLMIILVIVPVTVITALVGWTILDEWNNDAVSSSDGSHNTGMYVAESKTAVEIFDTMMIFIVIGVIMGSAILATQIRTHPVFIIPGMLVIVVLVFGAAQIANVTNEVYTHSDLSTAANEFPGFQNILNDLPLIILVGAGIIAYALYAKPFGLFGGGESTI